MINESHTPLGNTNRNNGVDLGKAQGKSSEGHEFMRQGKDKTENQN